MSNSAVGAGANPSSPLGSLPRPTLGGRTFLRTYVTARALGRLHPRLARPALERLWLTPWVHRSALQPLGDVDPRLRAWSLDVGDHVLRGFAGGEQARTVVLVHGWAGRAADWRHLAPDLVADGWRVVAPDLPAHGMTAGTRTNVFQLGEALAAVLRHERPAAIVAHSLGFPVTVRALAHGAPRPGTLVALAPGRKMRHALERFADRAELGDAMVDEVRRLMADRFGDDVWEALDVDPVLADLPPGGLVVHDAEDDEVDPADGRHIADRWPGASLVTTAGLGHRRLMRDAAVRKLVVRAVQPAR